MIYRAKGGKEVSDIYEKPERGMGKTSFRERGLSTLTGQRVTQIKETRRGRKWGGL